VIYIHNLQSLSNSNLSLLVQIHVVNTLAVVCTHYEQYCHNPAINAFLIKLLAAVWRHYDYSGIRQVLV